MNNRVFGVGETVYDIVLRDGKPQAAVPGGSVFNSIVSLGRTAGIKMPEVPLYMITQSGDDPVADVEINFLKDNNVRTEYVDRVSGIQSVLSLAMLDSANNATYEFFKDPATPPFKAPSIDFKPGDYMMFGSFFAIGQKTAKECTGLVKRAHESGAIVYYDVNFRKSHLKELNSTRQTIIDNMAMSDVVRASSEDIEAVFGSSDPAYVYEKYISPLCGTYICTRGADSILVFSPDARTEFDVEQIPTVSTIGAGDSFNAGFVYALLNCGFDKQKIAELSAEDWTRLIPVANSFSLNVVASIENYVDKDFANKL